MKITIVDTVMIRKISIAAFTTFFRLGQTILLSSILNSSENADVDPVFFRRWIIRVASAFLESLFTFASDFTSTSLLIFAHLFLAGPAGFEPTTLGFGDRRSTSWSYGPNTLFA